MDYGQFKRIIDNARDILVGKLPNPVAQVDAISYALIYKFMSDIDDDSALLGGKRTYFSGEYEKYSWHTLMSTTLAGNDRVLLYREALEKMHKNPNIPPLFREIFTNATLNFNDPNTLTLFLKEIDKIKHGSNDAIGDAYEYLLSTMGAQQDLGQFRTPRHIIDFIVKVVKPEKNDKILDPACGTAGFLISAYKYIKARHANEDRLDSEDIEKMHRNFYGFDIEPNMTRIARVNMFLHGFKAPKISEHDTLSSEDYWNDRYDIILANPPFMTPKGGISPHKKFSVSSRKSQVLFTDYILTHLKPNGRAGFVIPEGILATIDGGFKAVRKELLENGLFAVVSLPVGVFNPYSPTTKTSLLFVDKSLKKDNILYINVEADGYSLGTDRHKISKDDLPMALHCIEQYLKGEQLGESAKGKAHIISKELLTKRSDLRLDYAKAIDLVNEQENDYSSRMKELFNIEKGKLQSSKNVPGEYPFVTAAEEFKTHNAYTHEGDSIVFAAQASGSLGRVHRLTGKYIVSDLCYILTPKNKETTNIDYYYHYLRLNRDLIVGKLAKGSNKKAINITDFGNLLVPHPPIKKQNEINEIIANKRLEVEKIQREISSLEKRIVEIIDSEKTAIESA